MIGSEAYWIHLATRAVEVAGTAIIVVGAFGALALFPSRNSDAAEAAR